MAHGVNTLLKRAPASCKIEGKTGVGSRRIFPPHFKLQVLDSYRNDSDCKGNQRATARKYGIHRRQIQKWLQVENNLRNTVIKGTSAGSKVDLAGACESRKCDVALRRLSSDDDGLSPDAYGPEATRVPDQASVALDFTTHRRLASPFVASTVPPDPSAPIDLSLKRPALGDICTPVSSPLSPPHSSSPLQAHSPTNTTQPDTPPQSKNINLDVWDLSTKTIKRKLEEDEEDTKAKPVKLFKPYLDDSSSSSDTIKRERETTPTSFYHHPYDYYYNNNNNNNNVYESYTIQELHPANSPIYYYHPISSAYPLYPSPEIEHYPYEDIPKQRQSYSVDFKLSAIECYHQDELCRGNQRAVASKYNIHRRQVQKWLQQEEELRQRCEIKPINVS